MAFFPLSPLPGLLQRLIFLFLCTVDVDSQKGLETASSRLSQACPMCSLLSIQDFRHPTDAYPVVPRSSDMLMAISHWRCGNHRQVSMLNQVTQASGSPPEVTRASSLSLRGPWVLPSTPASPLSRRASSRATGPHPLPLQQAQRMDQPSSSPLRCRGWVLRGEASPWHPRRLSIAQSTQKASHLLQPQGMAQPGGA